MSSIRLKIIPGRQLSGKREDTNWPDNWPTTVEADGCMETNYILLTTSVYVEFFHNKKVFSKGKKVQSEIQLYGS